MFTQCVKIKDNVKVKQNLDTMCEDKRYSKKKNNRICPQCTMIKDTVNESLHNAFREI